MQIYFKLEMTVIDFQLGTLALEYIIQRSHIKSLRIYRPSEDDQKKGHKAENAHCEVLSEWKIPTKAISDFEHILKNDFGDSEEDSRHSYLGPDGMLVFLPEYSVFSPSFRSSLKNPATSAKMGQLPQS